MPIFKTAWRYGPTLDASITLVFIPICGWTLLLRRLRPLQYRI